MKKFKTVNGDCCRLALTSGHVYFIDTEWKDLPAMAHSAAYAQGCISEDMVTGDSKVGLTTEVLSNMKEVEMEKRIIRDAIQKAIDTNDLEFFKKDGDPSLMKLNQAIGRSVEKNLVKDVWGTMTSSRDIDLEDEV